MVENGLKDSGKLYFKYNGELHEERQKCISGCGFLKFILMDLKSLLKDLYFKYYIFKHRKLLPNLYKNKERSIYMKCLYISFITDKIDAHIKSFDEIFK